MSGGGLLILVGRDSLIREIIHYSILHRSLFIKAGNGSGKTALLSYLQSLIPGSVYSASSTKKDILLSVAGCLKLLVKGKRVFELFNDIILELEVSSCTLLLDDVHEVTKSIKALLLKFLNHGLVIVCTGSLNVFNLPEVRMPSLSCEDIELIINSRLESPDPLLVKLIANNCSTPQEVVLALRRSNYYDLRTRESKHKFIDSIRVRKRELLPIWSLAVLISFMLSMRYFFYMKREYQSGYTLAFIAYLLRALSNLRKRA